MLKKLLFALPFLLLFSCSQDSDEFQAVPELGQASFTFSKLNRENNNSLSAKSLVGLNDIDPYAVVFTITNSNNEVIVDNRELLLLSFGTEFITESIGLDVGDYEITSFNIVNAQNEVIYASPLQGSQFAQLVSNPLPIPFSVFSNETTTVIPEVILVLDTDSPEQFGFVSFSFNIIETENLFVSVKEVVDGIVNDVNATFELTIQNNDYTLSGNIESGSSGLIIPEILDDSTEISITVTYNTQSQTQVITNGQLNEYGAISPLTFYFGETNIIDPLEPVVPSFTFSSSEDYSIKTFVNTTPNTTSVIWTMPSDVTFVNGTSATSETIEVMFPASGSYTVSLEVVSEGFSEAGELVSLIGSSTVIVPVVNSINEIVTPVIIGGGFERPADENLSAEGLARTSNDLGKEYWIADGVSARVFTPGTTEAFAAYPGETTANERIWFENYLFNRIGVTSVTRTGDAAATWDASQTSPRAIVQYIEIVPGVDYKVSFFYSNDLNSSDISLQGLILDSGVVKEADISPETIIAQGLYNEQANGDYTEASLSFTVNSSDQTAIKLYFNTTDVSGDYRLDDISIAID